ncbi:MAG: hypothetical protein MI919_35345, partial [Holophagales bacterium]|nr:hypothetical protein [Holophagales bacterium]
MADATDSEPDAGQSPRSEETPPDEPRVSPFSASAWNLIRRLWLRVRQHRRYVWWMGVSLVLGAPMAVVSPLIVQRLVDDAVERGQHEEVWKWGAVLLVLTVAGVVLEILRGWAKTVFDHKVRRDLQQALYDHVQRLSVRYHRERETGYLLSRIHDDVANLDGVMADSFVRAAVDGVTALVYLGMLFYVEWRMATGGLVLVVLIFGLLALVSPHLRQLTRDEREKKAELGRALHQALTGQILVRSTGAEKREARHVRRAIHVGNMTFNDGHAVEESLKEDVMQSVKPLVQDLLNAKEGYRIMIYNGQLD